MENLKTIIKKEEKEGIPIETWVVQFGKSILIDNLRTDNLKSVDIELNNKNLKKLEKGEVENKVNYSRVSAEDYNHTIYANSGLYQDEDVFVIAIKEDWYEDNFDN